ncbi:MAG: bifunctional folylpolyglutamate synthase/dihydrofolate synthase [Alphaproteobacteria bacterium]|nr:MAG: bifunctional folylpolyglutamate synthase/dihydrofolate synthase [Alphaproteobacteria bacterium]
MADSNTILDRLFKLHPKLIDLELTRVLRLLDALGRPQDKLPPVIHIGGTNGKGSALAYLKAMYEAAGQRVHAYTSPHLVHFHERIVLAGREISEDHLVRCLERCEAANAGAPITHFEITTAAALLAFSETPADITLLEVGLGGAFDATNVIDKPAATVITPIDLDHQSFLGDTIEEIAMEKAGIIKPGVPLIVGPQQNLVRGLLSDVAEAKGANAYIFGQDWQTFEEHGRFIYQDEQGLLDLPLPGLFGRHQLANAGTAIATLRALPASLQISDGDIERGLETVRWPARMQRLTRGPLAELAQGKAELWLDGGHNPHAAAALSQTLADLEDKAPRPLHLIFGMLKNKDAQGYLAAYQGLARHVSVVPIPGEDAHDTDTLYEAARKLGLEADKAASVEDALAQILARPQEAPRILICGSLYLAGQVLKENG